MSTVLEVTVKALAANLDNAMKVAGIGQKPGSSSSRLTQEALKDKTGVARSTVSRLLNGEADNVDLKTICKLAYELNIPPALLLLTSSDIKRLIDSTNFLPYLNKKDVMEKAEEILSTTNTNDKSELIYEFANHVSSGSIKDEIEKNTDLNDQSSLKIRIKQSRVVGNFVVQQQLSDKELKKIALLIFSGFAKSLKEE